MPLVFVVVIVVIVVLAVLVLLLTVVVVVVLTVSWARRKWLCLMYSTLAVGICMHVAYIRVRSMYYIYVYNSRYIGIPC